MARVRDKSSHWTDKLINNDYHCIHHIPPESEAAREGEQGDPHFVCFHDPRTAHEPQRIHTDPRDYVPREERYVTVEERLAMLNAPEVPPRIINVDPTVYNMHLPRNVRGLGSFNPAMGRNFASTPFSVIFHQQEISRIRNPQGGYPLYNVVVNYYERRVRLIPN